MRIYHRIDDIREYSDELKNILDFFEKNTKEFILAAIPLNFAEQYIEVIGKYKHCEVYQHGYDHFNRVPKGWCDEFPDTMSLKERKNIISDGKKELERKLNIHIKGYVPPWNNTGEKTMEILEELGFEVYSAQENNTHCYLTNKDISIDIVERYVPEIIYKDLDIIYSDIARLCAEYKNEELGIMYHFSNPSEDDLEKIREFVINVEKLNEV